MLSSSLLGSVFASLHRTLGTAVLFVGALLQIGYLFGAMFLDGAIVKTSVSLLLVHLYQIQLYAGMAAYVACLSVSAASAPKR